MKSASSVLHGSSFRVIHAIPAVLLVLLQMPVTVEAQFNYITNEGTITITSYSGPGGTVAVPEGIDGFRVSTIGALAFYGCSSVTSILIPDTVTTVGDHAFSDCPSLNTVALGNGVTSIGEYAFAGCGSLTCINIPASVTALGPGLFYRCTGLLAITVSPLNPVFSSVDGVLFDKSHSLLITCPGGKEGAYDIPNTVERIEEAALCHCTKLASIAVPDTVTIIGNIAFSECANLTNVMIGTGVSTISYYSAFNSCARLTTITVSPLNPTFSSLDGALLNKAETTLFRCPPGRKGSYTVPNTVNEIWQDACSTCTSLTSITIPNSVTKIGDRAFWQCDSLIHVVIGNGLATIGDYAFAYCPSLQIITVDPLNEWYSSRDGVLFNKTQTSLIQFPAGRFGGYEVPNSVLKIGTAAFENCVGLESITIPPGVASIGGSAFLGCSGLRNATIPDTVTEIGDSAFSSCYGLTNAVLPSTLSRIECATFALCHKLQRITVPSTVTNIGERAFWNCASMSGAYFRGNTPTVGWDAFDYGAQGQTVYFLPGSTGWSNTFVGCPTALWLPRADAAEASFGMRTNQFGFNINWAAGRTVVVEASNEMTSPVWNPLATNSLVSDTSYFNDPDWEKHQQRFYRLRSN